MSGFIIVNLALGAIVLFLILPSRPQTGGLAKLVLGICVGLAAGVVLINVTTSRLGTSRDSNIRPVVKYALEQADPSKAQLLLVGSSYSALGIDSGVVEREMRKKGYPLQVLSLSKPGNFVMSQDYTIEYYLDRAKKLPDVIFIELGPEFYTDPGDMGPSYLDTGTAISDHSADQLWWRARSFTVYPATPLEKATKYWNLSTHFLFHTFDLGLSGQLISDNDLSPLPGFGAETKSPKPVLTTDIAPIANPAMPVSNSPVPPQVRFLMDFRRMQVQKLKARGVKVVGFYQPPMISVDMRVYGIQTCRGLRGVPCITFEDPAIRRTLDNPKLWFDSAHLLYPGAEKYSAWFADRLAASLKPFWRSSK